MTGGTSGKRRLRSRLATGALRHPLRSGRRSGASPVGVLAFLASVLATAILLAPPAMGATDDPRIAAICDTAAAQVSRESGVPLSVLRAISLTETGRSKGGAFRPWPWTVNMEGKGVWFRTRAEAQDYVDAHFERGARSFDVGCFQINYKWHGAAFATIEEMFDPVANARYAARFLGELRAEFGDWSRAAGAYHSRTPQVANRYRARFDRIRARLTGPGDDRAAETVVATRPAAGTVPQPPPVIRANLFPLLQPQGGRRGAGSLVPLTGEPASGLRMIGGPGRG